MRLKTWHQIHKWIAIVVGVFFLTWTISGIVMILPRQWFAPNALEPAQPTDYRSASLSPAQAISRLESSLGNTIDVSWVGLRQLRQILVYEIYLTDGHAYLANATSGDVITITPELAEGLVRDGISSGSEAGAQTLSITVQLLTAHDMLYPFGALPVYRVQVEGDASNLYYVSTQNGAVSQSNWRTRLSAAISSLHTFEPVQLIVRSDAVQSGLLVLFAAIGVAAALTGYLLALLPLFRRRAKTATGAAASRPLDDSSTE